MKKSSSSGVTSPSLTSQVIESSTIGSSTDGIVPSSSSHKLTKGKEEKKEEYNDPSSSVNVTAIRCNEVSLVMSQDNRSIKQEQCQPVVDRKGVRRTEWKDDKREEEDFSSTKFDGRNTKIGSKGRSCQKEEGLDVVRTSEPLKEGKVLFLEQNQLFNGKKSTDDKRYGKGQEKERKLSEIKQEGREGAKSFKMEDEDEVDNKSHSSLDSNFIEEERKKEESERCKEQDMSSSNNGEKKKVLEDVKDGLEKRRKEESEERRKKVSMDKGGIKSCRLKRLTHPLDRSVSYVFTVTIFFTFIALISGLPILITISSLLPITWIISYIFSCQLFYKTTSWDKVTSSSRTSSSSSKLIPLTHMEAYWAGDSTLINNYRRGFATCLLYFDQGLTLEQFKDVLVARVLSKGSMSRFRAAIVYKGASRRAFWKVIPMDKLPLDSLVIQEPKVIESKSDLRSYVYRRMNEPLENSSKYPPWKITLVRTTFINQVVLIIRVHQSICDGIGLLSTLIEQLADQAPPSTTTFIRTCQGTMTATNSLFKPRFGGINFSVNVFRAILAGPLTLLLWILWSFTRRKYNFLQSFPFYSSPDYNDNCGIKVSSEQEGNESEYRKQEDEYEGVRTKRKGRRKDRGKRSHHHHDHQQEQKQSTRKGVNCHGSESGSKTKSKNQAKNGNNLQQQQPHSSQQEQLQQLQQFDKRNMSSCESGKGVLFTSPSSTMDDKVLCKEFDDQHRTGEMMVVVPTESVSLVTGGQKSGGKNVLKGGGRKLLTRAFGSHSPLSSSCSRIKSATSDRMRMSTGITSSSSISPSSSEKGRSRPKDEMKLQLQQEDLLEMKSMTELGKEKGNMTSRLKERMMNFMGGKNKEGEEESDGRMKNYIKRKKKEDESHHKTSRLPSLSNHSSSIHSQGSKSSSGRNNKRDLPSHKKIPTRPFNYSFSSSSNSAKRERNKTGPRKETELDSLCDPIRSIHWSSVDLTKVYRVKQVTRSCLNDVVLTAISGSIRDYLVKYSGVDRPPNLALSIPVDVRVINDSDSSSNKSGGGGGTADSDPSVSFVMLTSPLPTRTEGAIPRMWEVKQLTDEIKASPDAVVMYGTHYYFHNLFPSFISRTLINLIHRNSSLSLSNLQGPPMNITVNSHLLHSIQYFMSVPPTIPVTFNVITYGHKLFVSVTSTSILIPSAKKLFNLFSDQIDLLADLLSKRRIPGESRAKKRPHHVIIEAPIGSRIMGGLSPVTAYSSAPFSTKQLLDRLHHVQYEVNRLNEALDEDCPDADAVNDRLSELKAEFGHLVKQIRRRKSIAEYGHNIVFSSELEDVDDDDEDDDDDMDGEMRPPPRRFSFVPGVSTSNVARRSSIVSAISSFGGSSTSIISGRRSPGTMTASSSSSLEHPPSQGSSYVGSSSGHTFPQSLASRYKRFSLTPSTTVGTRSLTGAAGSRSVPGHHQSPSDTLSSSPSDSSAMGSSFRSESIV